MLRARPVLSALTTAVLTASALVVAAPALAATDTATVASGVVARDGTPVAGATVTVRIWPSEQVLHNLPDGTAFDLLPMPGATTDSKGHYSARVPFALPADYLAPDGSVNVELVASDGDRASTQSVTVHPESDRVAASTVRRIAGTSDVPQRWAQGMRGSSTGAARLNFDLGTAKASQQRAAALAKSKNPGDVAAVPSTGSAVALGVGRAKPLARRLSGGGCVTATGSRHGPYMEKFAEMYGTPYVKGRIYHHVGATHTVGIGVLYSGAGSWAAGGTQSTSSGWGYDTKFNIVDAAVSNRVYERYFLYTCVTSAGKYTTTFSRPDGIADGPYFVHISHVNFGTCSPGYVGGDFHRNQYRNGEYRTGLDLPFINLSAQAGWNTAVESFWEFYRPGYICGSNGIEWGYAPRVSTRA
jgi:hypothetical protein